MNTNKKWQINLLNLTTESITNLILLLKEKKFNVKQINDWLYKKNVKTISVMHNISKNLRHKLITLSKIENLTIKKECIDQDNTIKWIIETSDKNIVETVAIPNGKNHFTICISSQIGCILNCDFCSTGKNGFIRNLKTFEILSQLIIAQEKINKNFSQKKITNIVMMGMGEPLLNLENVLSFISIVTNKDGINISKKKITISTSGITPNIEIINKNKIQLALSLHSTNNSIRSKLMPINKKYPIKDLINECKKYSLNNNLTIEYLMLENINDSPKDALNLINMLKSIKCKVCLIPFNKISETNFNSTKIENIIDFQNILKKNGIITNIRKRKGSNINAACGQLAGIFKK